MGNKSKKHKKLGQKRLSEIARKRTNLQSVLQSIYHDSINLESTCKQQNICCKVAMPQINYSEFLQILSTIYETKNIEEILDIVCTSVEYFFRYEYAKWGMETMVKPCMLLSKEGRCTVYKDRPLSCRMYGLWPDDIYNRRVDKFEKAYAKYNIQRGELPLSTQCNCVKRVDESVPLTEELIEKLYQQLNDLDKKIGTFSELQIKQRENYRTFHDWLLLSVYGEDGLSNLTTFILKANKEIMEDQIKVFKEVLKNSFKDRVDKLVRGLIEKAKV